MRDRNRGTERSVFSAADSSTSFTFWCRFIKTVIVMNHHLVRDCCSSWWLWRMTCSFLWQARRSNGWTRWRFHSAVCPVCGLLVSSPSHLRADWRTGCHPLRWQRETCPNIPSENNDDVLREQVQKWYNYLPKCKFVFVFCRNPPRIFTNITFLFEVTSGSCRIEM